MKRRSVIAGLALVVCALWASTAFAQIRVYDPVTEGWRNYGCNAIDAAIDDFNADTTLDGKILRIDPGTYMFTHQITPRAGSQVIGDGAHLQAGALLDTRDLIKIAGDSVLIKGIYLDRVTQERAAVTGNGINLSGYDICRIIDVTIEMQNNCVTTQAQDGGSSTLADAADVTIQGSVLRYTKAEAIRLKGWCNTVRNCKISYTLGDAIYICAYKVPNNYEQLMVNIMESAIHFSGGAGIKILSVTFGENVDGDNILIQGNQIDQTYCDGIIINGCDQVDVAHNQIRGCGSTVTAPSTDFYPGWTTSFLGAAMPSYGIHVYAPSDYITIDANVICSNWNGGIYLENATSPDIISGPDNVIISNNQIYKGYASGGEGINIYALWDDWYTNNITINSNQIKNFDYGIYQYGPAVNYVITNNICSGNTTSIGLDGPPSPLVKEHNIE